MAACSNKAAQMMCCIMELNEAPVHERRLKTLREDDDIPYVTELCPIICAESVICHLEQDCDSGNSLQNLFFLGILKLKLRGCSFVVY